MVDERFLLAIAQFNAGEFFACHDTLEELWSEVLDERRDLYQGLIHAAVALFHFSEGNLGGARKMYTSTLKYLSSYGPQAACLDLLRFRQDFRMCFQELVQHQGSYPQGICLHPHLIPQLHWFDIPETDLPQH